MVHHRLADVDERPTWRGRSHLWAFGLALPATVVLVAGAHPGRPRMVVLWRRWPDPRPRHFGYHEVWHLFTIVAAASHFAAVASVVR